MEYNELANFDLEIITFKFEPFVFLNNESETKLKPCLRLFMRGLKLELN